MEPNGREAITGTYTALISLAYGVLTATESSGLPPGVRERAAGGGGQV